MSTRASSTSPSSPMRFRLRRRSDRSDTNRSTPSNSSDFTQHLSGSPLPIPSNMRGMRRLEIRRTMEETHFLAQKARNSNMNPPVDMRLLDYVGTYDTNLMCPICRCPFVDPVVLYGCDHCFCRDCLHQTWTERTPNGLQGTCPTCRASSRLAGTSAVSKILVNILDDLLVSCPKHEYGCTHQLKRGEVQDHINLYCSFAWVECSDEACELPVRRKDARTCLHHGVSCIDCHETTTLANLETHWRNECPDRKVTCQACNDPVFYRELESHNTHLCPAITAPCTGKDFGCSFRAKRSILESHTKTCTLATLAPFLQAQEKRQDEQEEAQKLLTRKVQILEGGFSSLENLLYPRSDGDSDVDAADETRIPLLEPANNNDNNGRNPSSSTFDIPQDFDENPSAYFSSSNEETRSRLGLPPDFPFPASSDPYASPVNHLLSLHESLRDEMARIATALQELDGRHSMLILNENIRLKEDMAYLGAQVSGVARQVGWLTSARLQQSQQQTPSSSNRDGGDGGEGAVQGAVSSAATALRGAARVVSVGREGLELGRRTTDEGRTKL